METQFTTTEILEAIDLVSRETNIRWRANRDINNVLDERYFEGAQAAMAALFTRLADPTTYSTPETLGADILKMVVVASQFSQFETE